MRKQIMMTVILLGMGAATVLPAMASENPCRPKDTGADAGEKTVMEKFLAGEYVTLRQSLEDKNTANKAATIQWTDPDNGKDSHSVAAAAAMEISRSGQCKSGGFDRESRWEVTAGYYRNTIIDKPKNTQQAGLVWNYELSTHEDGATAKNIWRHQMTTSLMYKDDRIKSGKGIQYGVSYVPMLPPKMWPWGPEVIIPLGNAYAYWSLSAALQGEHADGLGGDESGDVYRAKPSASVHFIPWAEALSEAVSLQMDYAGWYNFSKSGPFDDYSDYQKLFVATLQVGLLKAPEDRSGKRADVVALALEYHNGANPEEGEEDQSYTQLVLKLRL